MEQVRIALYVALAVILVFIWQAWRADQVAQAPTVSQEELPRGRTSDAPPMQATPPGATELPPAPEAPPGADEGPRVVVETDLLRAVIDTRGADLRELALLTYPVDVDAPEQPYLLLAEQPARTFYTQSGLLGEGMPDHQARYSAPAERYRLEPGQERLEVPLSWRGSDGTVVRKVYTFRRDDYVVDLRYELEAPPGASVSAEPYAELVRVPGADAGRSLFNPVSFQGAAFYTAADRFGKLGYSDMAKKPLASEVEDGWVALTEHYFLAALLPPEGPRRCHTRALRGERYAVGCVAQPLVAQPGEPAVYPTRLFLGPKEHARLKAVAPGLDLTVDFGVLTVLSKPLFWLLTQIERLVGNWGIAIILVTALIKLAFYRLSATSYRSMAHLRRVQPRMLELRERYKDDRAKLNEKMMELYRSEKVNPLGGCLPIVVQIPVFIALYWVLLESVELRHAPFFLWIDDLSSKDPYYVLPVLMGVSMLLQQRMTPTPMEPMQQRIMMALPVVFTVFFALFPAGLVLYWLVNNVLSIAQQWLITRQIERTAPA